jgi:hypothetical protein
MGFFTDAANLYARYKQSEVLRRHVDKRVAIVIAVAAVLLLASASISVGTALYLGGRSTAMVLAGLVAAPFVLLGSLAVQLYVFFSWLEARALAEIARPRAKMAPIPIAPAVIFVLLPFIGLCLLTWHGALGLVLIVAFTFAGYLFIDRVGD